MPSQLPEEILYDVRLIERHVRQGLITRQDVEKYQKALQDRAAEADVTDLEALQLEYTG